MTTLDHQVNPPQMGQHHQKKPKQGFFYRHVWQHLVSAIGSLLIVVGCQLRSSVGNTAPLHALVDACQHPAKNTSKK